MQPVGAEWILHEGRHVYDGYFKLKEQASAVTSLTPTSDHLHLYAKDKSGTTELFYKNSAGTERDLSLIPTVGTTVITGATTGSIFFAGASSVLQQDNANLFWDDTNNRLAIGVGVASITPIGRLEVNDSATGSPRGITSAQHTGDANGACLFLRKSRGTRASPVLINSADELGKLTWQGYGTSFVDAAEIKAIAGAAFSATVATSRLTFSTTPASSVTLTERMRLMEDGDLVIGHTSAPSSTLAGRGLHLARGTGTTELVLYNQQAGGGLQGGMRFMKTRGTLSAPTATQATDGAFWALGGYKATAYAFSPALMSMVAGSNWSDTSTEAFIEFWTTPASSTTPVPRIRILPTGQLRLAELDTNPGTADLAADAALAVYTKADKLVFAYNNGGTVTYITLDLDGSDVTWAHGTSAP